MEVQQGSGRVCVGVYKCAKTVWRGLGGCERVHGDAKEV